MVGKVLFKMGETVRSRVLVYKADVQFLLLYGSDGGYAQSARVVTSSGSKNDYGYAGAAYNER